MLIGIRRRALAASCLAAIGGMALLGGAAAAQESSNTSEPTLTVWAFAGQGNGYQQALTEDSAAFQAQYHAKIVLEYKSFNNVFLSAKLALGSPGGPDIIQLPQGWPMVQLAAAGLLLNLNKYEQQFHWTQRFTQSNLVDNEATANGKYFGTGNLYALSDSESYLGLFYNKSILAKLGLTVPKTLAQFEKDCAVAIAHGQNAIEFGDSNGAPALQTYYELLDQYAPANAINAFALGTKEGGLPVSASVKAATTFTTWATDGYLSPGWLGVTDSQALATFLTGKGLFNLQAGSWTVGNIYSANMQNKIGFLILPGLTANAAPSTVATVNNPYGVNASTKYPLLAAEWLNEITNPAGEQRAVTLGQQIPSETTPFTYAKNTLLGVLFSDYIYLQKHGSSTIWLDWASPTIYTQLSQNVQSMLGGKMSAASVIATANSNQSAFIQTLHR
jgi:raffinose/stachyose/melibiose transport system substrate-binding protein